MLIDTHTHLNFEAFGDDWRSVVDDANINGVEKMIVVGTDLGSSKRAVEMAGEHPALYAAVGIHPHHARIYLKRNKNRQKILNQVQDDVGKIGALAIEPKVVAIGEVGLDYHYYRKSKYHISNDQSEWETVLRLQRELFKAQIEVAIRLDKPLIIHSREAKEEVLEMVLRYKDSTASLQNDVKGVFHCFEGTKGYAKRILEAGLYLSFTGQVTFAHDRAEVAKEVPLDRLLLETDCPYMTPVPRRGERNTPSNVKLVAEHYALSRQVSVDTIVDTTSNTARQLFGM